MKLPLQVFAIAFVGLMGMTGAGCLQLIAHSVYTDPFNVEMRESVSAPGSWEAMTPMPVGISDAAFVSVGSYGYNIGGYYRDGEAIGDFLRYDSMNGTWAQLTPMPTPRWGPTATETGGRIYVFAGADGPSPGNTPVATVESYDLKTGNWSTEPPLPPSLAGQGDCSASLNGILYILRNDSFAAYDPASRTYRTLPRPEPGPGIFGVCVIIGLDLWVFGGSEGTGLVHRLNLLGGHWEVWDSPPWVPRYGMGAALWNGGILMVDGFWGTHGFLKRWTQLASPRIARDGVSVWVLGSSFYISGGRGIVRSLTAVPLGLADVERYRP